MNKTIICPWCGKEMGLKTECDARAIMPWSAWLECTHCGATSPVSCGLQEELVIKNAYSFAKRFKQPEPCHRSEWPKLWTPVLNMNAEERLKYIWEIGLDWDGARTAKNLGELVDEIIAYCAAPLSKTWQNRPLTREEVENLPVGTPYYSEYKPPFEDDSHYAEINFENEYAGDGYGRVYRYWLHRPNEKEKVEFEWE